MNGTGDLRPYPIDSGAAASRRTKNPATDPASKRPRTSPSDRCRLTDFDGDIYRRATALKLPRVLKRVTSHMIEREPQYVKGSAFYRALAEEVQEDASVSHRWVCLDQVEIDTA